MQKRFTFIEMLVVLAILGILTTILLPSLRKAREASRSAVCMSNLKQIGSGSYLYAKDNPGKFTISQQNPNNPDSTLWYNNVLWKLSYLPYEESIMTCPSLPVEGDWHEVRGSYIYGIANDASNRRKGWLKKEKNRYVESMQVESPSDFFLYADSAKAQGSQYAQNVYFVWSQTNIVKAHARHNESVNIWFIDGHAQGNKKGALRKMNFTQYYTEGFSAVNF